MAEQRLIDANELKKGIMNHCAFGKEWDRTLAVCEIDSAPTVDAVPVVHGHWIKVKDVCGISILKCSICGIDHPREATAYCCDCGAKMKPNFIA